MTDQPSGRGCSRASSLRRRPRALPLTWVAVLGLALPTLADSPPSPEAQASCRRSYLAFEAARGLEQVRQAAQTPSLMKGAAIYFLTDRLTELIGQDTAVALQVATWAESATGPELSLYLDALRSSKAVQAPAVVSRVLTLAETKADADDRLTALLALETQYRLEPEALERLTVLAKQGQPAAKVARHATRTLGRVMRNDFERTGHFEPYLDKLMELARGSAEPTVRTMALEMAGELEARLPGPAVAALGAVLKEDPDKQLRELAALVLSTGRDTQAVLEHFRQAFPTEKEPCVRRALVLFAARAAGAQALPLLRDFARADPRFKQDVADFQALYAAGHVDFNRVYMNKRQHSTACEGEGR
jgi:hypothetical protein